METTRLHSEPEPPPPPAPPEQTPPGVAPPIARGRLPLLGHIPALIRQPLEFVQGLRPQGDVVRIYLGPLPVYVVTAMELVRSVLVTQAAAFEQGRLTKKGKVLLGDSLVTSDGAYHQQQRRLMQPAFHRERIARYGETMVRLGAARAESWRPGQTVNVAAEMLALAMDIVLQTLISADATEFDTTEIPGLLRILFDGLAKRTLLPAELLERLPTPGNRRFDAANARLRQIIGAIISAYRADGRDRGDLLSMLLLARDEESSHGMTDRQVHDEITEIIVAGHETTGATLAWLFHELSRDPLIEARVHREVDTVLAGRPACLADLGRLEYTRRVVTETLRLHHPFWLPMKRAIAPVTLGGYHLPAGADLIFSCYALHRDPGIYPDPLTFDPDRWLPERMPQRAEARHAFLPFGAGKHRCIGESFAWAAMTLASATIAGRWRLQHLPGQAVRERPHLVIHPGGLLMTAIPREPGHS